MKKRNFLILLSLMAFQKSCTDISNIENGNQNSWLSQIDTVCQTGSRIANSEFVEQCNTIDLKRFFDKFEQYGSSEENPVNPVFSPVMQDLLNQVLMRAASDSTEKELKQYISPGINSDTLITNLCAIQQNVKRNKNVMVSQLFTGLPQFKYKKDFINFLHCDGFDFDTVPFWYDSLRRIEIRQKVDISFKFDKSKLQLNRKAGVFGTSSRDYQNGEMITISGIFPAHESDNYRVVKLGNVDNTLELFLLLPKSEIGIRIVSDSAYHLVNLPLDSQQATVAIPVCSSKVSISAMSRYNYYNVNTPFSRTAASFSRITDAAYLYVDGVTNFSEIRLEESGLTLKLNSNIWINENIQKRYSSYETQGCIFNFYEIRTISIDCYPFIYFVKDKHSNRILLIEKVNKI